MLLRNMSWTTIAQCSTTGEAELVRSVLDAAGIDVVIADEEMISLNWLYSNALGGIKVLVPEEDVERAATILTTAPQAPGPGDEVTEVAPAETTGVKEEPLRCPYCGSEEIARVPRLLLFVFLALIAYGVGVATDQHELAIAGIVAAALITLVTRTHRCKACGERWNAIEPPPRDEEHAPPPEPFDTVEEPCPRCGSLEFHRIDYRRLKLLPLFFNLSILLLLPVWPFLPKKQCDNCGYRK